MFIDAQAQLITFRILYVGPPGASKLLALRMLQSGRPAEEHRDLMILRTEREKVVTLTWEPADGPGIAGCRVGWEAVTSLGPGRSKATRQLLLRAADAVVFLPKRDAPGGPASCRALEELCEDLDRLERHPGNCPLLVQTYADDPEGQGIADCNLPDGWPRPRPTVVAGDTQEETARVFSAQRERLLERYRAMEREVGPEKTLQALGERAWPMGDPGRARRLTRLRLADVAWDEVGYWAAISLAAAGALAVTLLL